MEMNSWFETTVAIDQMQDDGTTKSEDVFEYKAKPAAD